MQYNCISLGFTVAAVSAILSDRDIFGSILFTLALNHKQVIYLSVHIYLKANLNVCFVHIFSCIVGYGNTKLWAFTFTFHFPLEKLRRTIILMSKT